MQILSEEPHKSKNFNQVDAFYEVCCHIATVELASSMMQDPYNGGRNRIIGSDLGGFARQRAKKKKTHRNLWASCSGRICTFCDVTLRRRTHSGVLMILYTKSETAPMQ
jgi:hypothetical protein